MREFKSGVDLLIEITPGIIETASDAKYEDENSFVYSQWGWQERRTWTYRWMGYVDLFGDYEMFRL